MERGGRREEGGEGGRRGREAGREGDEALSVSSHLIFPHPQRLCLCHQSLQHLRVCPAAGVVLQGRERGGVWQDSSQPVQLLVGLPTGRVDQTDTPTAREEKGQSHMNHSGKTYNYIL